MINFDYYTNDNKTKHNLKVVICSRSTIQNINNWSSGFGKTNELLNLINNQPAIDKIYLYAKDPYEAKYQFLNKKRESLGL